MVAMVSAKVACCCHMGDGCQNEDGVDEHGMAKHDDDKKQR